MQKVKLHLNKSQWGAMVLVINTIAPKLTNAIDDMAKKEQLQKIMLKLLNRLPTINSTYTKNKYWTLTLTITESWAFYHSSYSNHYGQYEELVVDDVRREINLQTA